MPRIDLRDKGKSAGKPYLCEETYQRKTCFFPATNPSMDYEVQQSEGNYFQNHD